ncbi:PCNA-associated factor [Lethenteron reissneri]|uniref:PCNA-associated factor n=1 Tax=Lethenteron reissneri TaxID=7753 RepID=UPI002AB753C9|nr:PCNA-associated factor [Lethenteron reissneri]
MVRTKADGGFRKVIAARAPRKNFTAPPTSPGSSNGSPGNKYGGGNSVCPRPTPTWQKGIGEFFASPTKASNKENRVPDGSISGKSGAGSSKASRYSEAGPSSSKGDCSLEDSDD